MTNDNIENIREILYKKIKKILNKKFSIDIVESGDFYKVKVIIDEEDSKKNDEFQISLRTLEKMKELLNVNDIIVSFECNVQFNEFGCFEYLYREFSLVFFLKKHEN